MKKLILAISILLLSFPLYAIDVPYLSGRVTDNAEILSSDTRRALSEILKAHEAKTTNQVAVLTVPSLRGENIEDYAVAVFEEWKLGQKERDNGILILVAPNDRQMRIEVGYGLEGVMTDILAGRIISNIMTPKFKKGDYNGGVLDGTDAVVKVLEGGEVQGIQGTLRTVNESFRGSNSMELDADLSISMRILFGAFIYGIIGLFTVIGIATPGVGWFLYVFLIPFWAMFPMIIIGSRAAVIELVIYIILFPVLKIFIKRTDWYKKSRKNLKRKGRASVGGFTFSSGRSSGSSWSSSSSSSFSGGGGSSGGGGASGSW